MEKNRYRTKQMTEILEYLMENKGKHITVSDVCTFFKSKGTSVGATTVYRHLERMVSEGSVAKYISDGNKGACFEYIGDGCCKPISCYHLKCEDCGRLIHLSCNTVKSFKEHMLNGHGFELDTLRTVFYGICSECRKKQRSRI